MPIETMKYIIYKEGKYYVSQCLTVDISSFGDTVEEATFNLKEALSLYFEDDQAKMNYHMLPGDSSPGSWKPTKKLLSEAINGLAQ